MEAYLQGFVNYEQNNWAKFLLMAKFAYNNIKNANTGYTFFKLNCGYHPGVFDKDIINSHLKSKAVDKLVAKLKTLMSMCKKNLYYVQKF